MTVIEPGIVFVITENNLREGGRRRDVLDAYLNVDQAKAAYLGQAPFLCQTDDGGEFEVKISGTHFKNFRSHHAVDLGGWIKARCRAQPGDEIHARWLGSKPGDVLGLSYVRKYALVKDGASVQIRRLERETEDALVVRLMAQDMAVRRQVRVATGIIDVLTPDTIYEVKTFLTRDCLFEAVGQLMVYQVGRGEGPPMRLVVFGRETKETAGMIPALTALNVEVELWSD
jgi:hypothetical protein